MPFRNPITTIGGTLIVPSLQSPDYSATLPPSHISVEGWSLNNDPSYAAAKVIYTEQVLVGSPDFVARNVDIVKAITLLAKNPTRMKNVGGSINPLTTSFKVAGFFPSFKLVSTPAQLGIRESWTIRAYYFFAPIVPAPTGNAIGTIKVVEYNAAAVPIVTTDLTTKTAIEGQRNAGRGTVSAEWVIKDSKTTSDVDNFDGDLTLNPNTVSFEVYQIVRSTVAAEYQMTTPSWMVAQPYTTVGYTP